MCYTTKKVLDSGKCINENSENKGFVVAPGAGFEPARGPMPPVGLSVRCSRKGLEPTALDRSATPAPPYLLTY